MYFKNIKEEIIDYSEEVKAAIANKSPLVALESTIITHGLPSPDNFKLATNAEKTIKENGATPVTIAIIKGRIKIGLINSELLYLSKSQDIIKISKANLATSISNKLSGGTTVSATLILAQLANIKVFVTGGIGGVHRGVNHSFDISPDLLQLSRSPISVVCAGPKAILDLPKTVEYLETLGVPIITYRNEMIPSFWSRNSKIPSSIVATTINEIVESHVIRDALGIYGGQLICNPVPINDEIPQDKIEPIIKKAVTLAKKENINGKALTPFLLKQISLLTKGRSVNCNKSLLINNAKLGATISTNLNNYLQT